MYQKYVFRCLGCNKFLKGRQGLRNILFPRFDDNYGLNKDKYCPPCLSYEQHKVITPNKEYLEKRDEYLHGLNNKGVHVKKTHVKQWVYQ